MLKEISEYLKPRQEEFSFCGLKLICRELHCAAEPLIKAKTQEEFDAALKDTDLLVAIGSVFHAEGDKAGLPLFTLEDLPELKAASRARFQPILEVVRRVNGQDAEANAKK